MASILRTIGACAVAGCVFAVTAHADEAEVMAHYRAYSTAVEEGRFADADTSAEAAWRAAEETWGADDQTAMLAFNLAYLRLYQVRVEAAGEPARRAAELREAGYGQGAVNPHDADYYARLTLFDPLAARRNAIGEFAEVLTAYQAEGSNDARISWIGWSAVAAARVNREQWEDAFAAAKLAARLVEADPGAPLAQRGAVGVVAARSGFEAARIRGTRFDQELLGEAVAEVWTAIAAYPPQPVDQPMDEILGVLLSWSTLMESFWEGNVIDLIRTGELEAIAPRWNDLRQARLIDCELEWLERRAPEYPAAGANTGSEFAVWIEYYFDTDGRVTRVDPIGGANDSVGFVDAAAAALQRWRAAPPSRPECRGPWTTVFEFKMAD